MNYLKLNCFKIQLEFDTIVANFQAASIFIYFYIIKTIVEYEDRIF